MGSEPGVGEARVLRFAREEVEEIDAEASQHQHLQVETVPVGAQVERDLKQGGKRGI